ncbi:unnamed protein product [Tuber aestivum]|uniref:Uncharacterized protein n=1 Tax=Tuber aestivum TaxID=59557 RepID=A0A292PJK0_9PEZI|nr:unnamed protein product [Tuber aestivum]
MPTMSGGTRRPRDRALTARLSNAMKLFSQRTDLPILATYSIRDILREYLRDNLPIFCNRPPPWAGSKTALLEKILIENLGPVYFTETSPGKYNYLDPNDKKMYETNLPSGIRGDTLEAALRNFMANLEEWQLKARDNKRARINSHWSEFMQPPAKN